MSITANNVFQINWPESSLTRNILDNLKHHFGGSIPDAADEESVLPLVQECVDVLIKKEDVIPLFDWLHLKDRDARSFINREIVRVDPPTFEVMQSDNYGVVFFEVVVRRRVAFHSSETKKVIKTITVDGVEYQNASMERILGSLKETEEVFSVFAYPKTIRIFSAKN